jgi:hypothetical protein
LYAFSIFKEEEKEITILMSIYNSTNIWVFQNNVWTDGHLLIESSSSCFSDPNSFHNRVIISKTKGRMKFRFHSWSVQSCSFRWSDPVEKNLHFQAWHRRLLVYCM